MSTPHSMTGFGEAHVALDLAGQSVRYRVAVRAVNHRFLDLKFRLGRELMALEAPFQTLLRERLHRGHVEVFLEAEGQGGAVRAVRLDPELAQEVYAGLEALRARLGLSVPVSLGDVLRSADVLTVAAQRLDPQAHQAAFLLGLGRAIDALVEMRAREGARLEADLRARVAALRAFVDEVRAAVPETLRAQQTRLRHRISALLNDPNTIDEGRLEVEIAVLADKSDVTEELTRLDSHLLAFEETLSAEAPLRGKKLEFLTQELLREVNTLGTKSTAPHIVTRAVISAKSELEKVREQVANLE